MSHLAINLKDIYNTYFQPGYKVNDNGTAAVLEEYGKIEKKPGVYKTSRNIPISEPSQFLGMEVFLPVTLKSGDKTLRLECCTIRVTNKKTIIRTAVSERVGTIKEQFNVGDYIFTIKGVLIAQNRQFPDEEILLLKGIYESIEPVEIHNALAELYFDGTGSRRVAIESIEFPEVQGKSLKHRPFSLVCETDYIDTLIISEQNI